MVIFELTTHDAHDIYPQMSTETLTTMVCFSTHADVRLKMYMQKKCTKVVIGSVIHASGTAAALIAHGGRGGRRELAWIVVPPIDDGLWR